MIGWAGRWTRTPSTTPLHPKKWNAHFCITFNIWCWPDWSMDLNPIHHPSPANKMKCFFLDYIQLLMIGRAGWWTQTLSTTPLQPIKWNASFWIMFTSDDQPGWLIDSNPICHPSPAKKMKCSLLDYIHFGWSARLVNGLKPHPPPLSTQKNEMLIFGLRSTSDDQPGLSMDLNLIHHPSPPKKMKSSFLGYVQLLMISWAVRWTQTPFATPLQPIKWNAHFWITFNFWWSAGLVDGLEPYPPPVCSQKMKCSYFDYVQLLMIGQAVWWTRTPSTTPLHPKKWNPHFYITFNFWCWPDWSMDSNPIHHPSPANKMKCFFLDYVHFWWSARLVDGLKPHLPPLSSQ